MIKITEVKNEKKVNLKSIRLCDTIFDYINKFEGEGFNEKFENIILFAMHKEKEKKEELKRLETLINQKNKELIDLGKKTSKIRDSLNTINGYVDAIESQCVCLVKANKE